MSHDTDKLIRQLSLVAFLMAERRALTARDIKGNVEGYQEMSDEAFARRFYSDRAELESLGVPLDSQRDDHTGESCTRSARSSTSCRSSSSRTTSSPRSRRALYLLEGQFAYSEPLRLALQNLALGRRSGARDDSPTAIAVRVEVRDPDYSPELQGRLGKLEGAISKQRTVGSSCLVDPPGTEPRRERSIRYALLPGGRHLVRDRRGPGRQDHEAVPRLADSLPKSASPRAASADSASREDFDSEDFRGRADRQFGDPVGRLAPSPCSLQWTWW